MGVSCDACSLKSLRAFDREEGNTCTPPESPRFIRRHLISLEALTGERERERELIPFHKFLHVFIFNSSVRMKHESERREGRGHSANAITAAAVSGPR